MANEEQLAILKQGAGVWNEWRKNNQNATIEFDWVAMLEARIEDADLTGVDLTEAGLTEALIYRAKLKKAILKRANLQRARLCEANLEGANLEGANLEGADLLRANLTGANLQKANLTAANLEKTNLLRANLTGANLQRASLWGANLGRANLQRARLREANLREANLTRANLLETDLSGADFAFAYLRKANLQKANLSNTNLSHAIFEEANLWGANLERADLLETNFSRANLSDASLFAAVLLRTQFSRANLSNCRIYGISAWGVYLEGAIQSNLIITDADESIITVDNLEIAQFIYLMLHNEKLRDVIDTIGKKAVLILGRFTPERKAVLDAIREELRKQDYIPIMFDFDKPSEKSLSETVRLLANMSRFVIADLTDPSSIPYELMSFVPNLTSVAVQRIILKGQRSFSMSVDLELYPWVLPIHEYEDQDQLIAELVEKVIAPAEAKVIELRPIAR